jgi:isoleucyl-tRNA synthetase
MSAFYLDISKDRLYVSHPDSKDRRSAQTAMFKILQELVRLTAPIFTFTSEEVWKEVPAFEGKAESVHLTEFELSQKEYLREQEKSEWSMLASYREQVLKLMEEARQRKEIGSSLDAAVVFQYRKEEESLIRKYERFLPDLFISSQVILQPGEETRFEIRKAEGQKCLRCWQIKPEVGTIPDYPDVDKRCADVLAQLV